MTADKFIRNLLKLKELVVCGYELNERKRQLLIFVLLSTAIFQGSAS